MRILVVEDSSRLRGAIGTGLRGAGYAVDTEADGREGLARLRAGDYDVVVLDIKLPGMDGLTLLRQARAEKVQAAVLLLSAMDTVEDRVRGLQAGADDYLVKPFAFEELLARVQALARRRHGAPNPTIRIGDLHLDTAARTLSRNGEPVALTLRELALLEYLAHRRGQVVSRRELEEHLYDQQKPVLSNAVDATVCLLRKKLGGAGGRELIRTRRGIGYILEESAR